MRANKTRTKLKAGGIIYGGGVHSSTSPDVVEILGAIGFDFVMIDCEHEPSNEESVENLVRAAEAFDITPLVRVPNNPDVILRLLDCGAQGVQVPHVRNKGEAQALVDAVKFCPEGKRTFYALCRSGNYTVNVTSEEFMATANEETLVVAMVEDMEGVDNLTDILSVAGVDAIHIGPRDLAQSMAFPGPVEVDRTIDRIVAATVAAGKVASLGGTSPQDIGRMADYAKKGVRVFTVWPRDFIVHGGQEFLHQARAAVARRA